MGENLWDLRLDLMPKHQNMIDHGGKIDKLDYIKYIYFIYIYI